MSRVLVLGHRDVQDLLSPHECADAMAEVLTALARGEAQMPLRSELAPPGAAGLLAWMPAWRGGADTVFSLKAVAVMPSNPARGLDAHQGVVVLLDGETGVPTAILDASAITAVRTAAVTAIATRVLAREDARVLAILGAGVQAQAHLDALLDVREFESVRVYSPTAAHARALADRGTVSGSSMSAAASAEDAVRGADVLVLATNSSRPVVNRDWFAPGVHVNAIGASIPSARELDVETVAASAFFCDSRESLRNEAGEYRLAVQEGAIAGEEHVRAELGEVLAGIRPGRRDDTELTVFRSLGLAVEDLAAAERAVAAARARGRGTEIEL